MWDIVLVNKTMVYGRGGTPMILCEKCNTYRHASGFTITRCQPRNPANDDSFLVLMICAKCANASASQSSVNNDDDGGDVND